MLQKIHEIDLSSNVNICFRIHDYFRYSVIVPAFEFAAAPANALALSPAADAALFALANTLAAVSLESSSFEPDAEDSA